jgi:hypothetical protein
MRRDTSGNVLAISTRRSGAATRDRHRSRTNRHDAKKCQVRQDFSSRRRSERRGAASHPTQKLVEHAQCPFSSLQAQYPFGMLAQSASSTHSSPAVWQ